MENQASNIVKPLADKSQETEVCKILTYFFKVLLQAQNK